MRARSYASTLAKTVQLQRHISTSCCLRAQLNLAEKPLTDEYGARPKRLQPLSRDGTVATKSELVHARRVVSERLIRVLLERSATSPLTKTSLRRSAEPIDEQVELEDDTDSQIDSPSAVVASTTFEQSVRANLAKYPDAILLTQVGSFFEVIIQLGTTLSCRARTDDSFCSHISTRLYWFHARLASNSLPNSLARAPAKLDTHSRGFLSRN